MRAASGSIVRRRSAPRAVVRALAALAVTALIGSQGGSPAQAAPFVDVTYDLDQSSAISVVDTSIVILGTLSPPQLSGSMKVRYASDSANGLVPGPSTLLTLNLSVHATVGLTYATVSGGTGQQIINTGTLRFHLTNPATGGTLLPGGTADPLGGVGQLQLTGTIHCYLLCAVISAPVSTPVPVLTTTFAQPLGPLYGAVGTGHTVTGTQYANFFFDVYNETGVKVNVIATTFIVGREVLREAVPEPGTFPLLGVGIAALAAVAVGRRLRSAD